MSNTEKSPCLQVGLNKLLCDRGRELRFRAWNRIVGRMSEPFGIDHDHGDTAWQNIDIMQYTGLADSVGKEICEGDILQVISLDNDHNQRGAVNILAVKCFMGNMCMCFKDCESGKPIYPTLNMSKRIVGNIYETPELY